MRALLLACLVASAAAWCGDCWCVASPPGVGVCPPAPLNYSAAFQLQLKKYQPENALSISCNPYNNSACTTTPPQFVTTAPQPVCGVRFAAPQCADGKYALQSFDSAADAERAGFFVTHTGVCGLCSTMQDLATYMGIFDMTSVGKKCGALAVLNEQLGLQCFQNLGLTTPCARIWTWDALYDVRCGGTCLQDFFAPNNVNPPACDLNACLACDETAAGPLFKAFAGRTRRRSNLASAITRPCASQANITHVVCPTVRDDDQEKL